MADFFALIDFGAYAMRSRYGREGSPVRQFFRLLTGTLDKLDPSHLAVALDGPREQLVRREQFDGYKANRPAPDEETKQLIRTLQGLLRELGVPLFRYKGWEADDIMGSLAVQLSNEDVHAAICSPDKDLAQLLSPTVHLFDSNAQRFTTPNDVQRKFGVPPNQICEYLALVGDRVDGIPGVAGVGAVKARQLLRRYGNLGGFLANAPDDGTALRELCDRYPDLELWADLTRIRTDLRFPARRTTHQALAFDGLDLERAKPALREAGVYGLLRASGFGTTRS